MRDRFYLAGFLGILGLLLFLGRELLEESVLLTWGLTFGGSTAVALLVISLYRVQLELRMSRYELARKEAELSFAREVQNSLFPKNIAVEGGLEFSAVCIPARGISGDYYDVLSLSEGRLVFSLADISGKGISAAILMSNLQALLRAVAPTSDTPAEMCRRLNGHLYQVTEGARFATFFCAEWISKTHQLRFCNAGHNPPLLFNDRVRRLEAGGFPLGIFPDATFELEKIELSQGDILVIYSDGVTEAINSDNEEFGDQRLVELIRSQQRGSLQQIQGAVLSALEIWSGPVPRDDVTLMLVRMNSDVMEARNETGRA